MKLYELSDLVLRRSARFTLHISEFSLERGEKVAVVGPNGSGKTTFLRLLALLDKPDSCAVFSYLGHPHTDRMDRNGMGVLNQQPYLFHGTVAQNLAYPLRVRRIASLEVNRRVETMLTTVELEHLAGNGARELSGGEQKRLALGRVLIADPDLLLLDEPTSHLDVRSQSVIEDVLKKTNKTILLATHNLPFALRVTDRALHLREGRVTSSLPENVFEGFRKGNFVEAGNGLRIELPPDVALTNQRGSRPVTIVIDPKKITLSRDPQPTGTQNQFRGRISAVREQGNDVWLKVVCGVRLTAIVSRASYEELGINLHKEVFVSFGSHDVEVLSNPRENDARRDKGEK